MAYKKNIFLLIVLMVFLTGCFGKQQPAAENLNINAQLNSNQTIPTITEKPAIDKETVTELDVDSFEQQGIIKVKGLTLNFLGSLSVKEINTIYKSNSYSSLVIQQGACNDLSGNEQQDCFDSVFMQQVVILNQPELCSQLSSYQDRCFESLAYKNKDLELCNSITKSNTRNSCKDLLTHLKALEDNNIVLCNSIINEVKRDNCFSGVMSQQNDLNYCNSEFISNNNLFNQCQSIILSNQAWQNSDTTLCEQIPLESYKQACFEEMPSSF